MLSWFLFFAGVLVFGLRDDYTPEALGDQITNLPGLPNGVNYTQFSGYINVGGNGGPNKYLFYWFVESQNDPVNDPVFYWTNGGPGCSGLGGFLTEQGPFRINSDGATITINDYAWTNVASGIFIEQPVGVGFSYSTGGIVGEVGDEEAAQDAYHFIQGWLELFPNYQSNDFYITSESYGGHYMPTTARAIVQGNNNGGNPQVNFKGVFVGNPYTNPQENSRGSYDTYYGKQLVSYPTWKKWYDDCDDGNKITPACETAAVQLNEELGPDIDPYALDYPVCNELVSNRYWFLRHIVRDTLKRPIPGYYEKMAKKHDDIINNNKDNRKLLEEDNPYGVFPDPDYTACSQNYGTKYLNRKDVQDAIYARNTTVWHDCGGVNYNYSDSENPMQPVWQWLIANSDLHMMVVSGDDDSVCGTIGTQSWIWDLGYPPSSTNNWVAWEYNNQVAGYFTDFDTSSAGSGAQFQFGTVHSAGHMIPATQPARSLQSFKNFLANKWS